MHRVEIKILNEYPGDIITGEITVIAFLTNEILGEMIFEKQPGCLGYKPAQGWETLSPLPESTWKQIGSHLYAYLRGKAGEPNLYFWAEGEVK